MAKTILITGANGVLAQKIIEKFADDSEYNVIASTRNKDNISIKNYKVQYEDNEDLISKDILKTVNIILHCAFPRKQDPDVLYEAMQFFECLVLKSIECNVNGFINISSRSVYGSENENDLPVQEIDSLHPQDNYALTKIACESIGWALTQNKDTKLTSIRLASLIGNEYPERAINKMIKIAKQTGKIKVQNDKNVLGYMDVEDAVKGLYMFIKNSDTDNWKPIYNFGPQHKDAWTLEKYANEIKKLFKKYYKKDIELEITRQEKADNYCYMNSSWFYETSGWKPENTAQNAIKRIFFCETGFC